MILYQRLNEQLNQLSQLLSKLQVHEYTQSVPVLSDASIGQHIRHIIEILQCLVNGYEKELVDYENRERNLNLETNIPMAIAQLENLKCVTNRPDKLLKMTIGSKHALNATIASYYSREIAYNLEHMIHHMALIKVALKVMGIPLTGDDFGVAYSTLQYKKELCAP